MNLENVNKKALIIILALIILLFINIPYLLFIVLFLAFLSPFLVGMLRFLKSDKVTKKETLKKYFFNIYWKKNLLFLFIFIITDIFSVILGNLSFNVRGFPIPYYSHYFQDPSPLFYPTFLMFNILFWYMIVGLIARKPIEMSAKDVRLNYITLGAVLFIMLYYFLPLISQS